MASRHPAAEQPHHLGDVIREINLDTTTHRAAQRNDTHRRTGIVGDVEGLLTETGHRHAQANPLTVDLVDIQACARPRCRDRSIDRRNELGVLRIRDAENDLTTCELNRTGRPRTIAAQEVDLTITIEQSVRRRHTLLLQDEHDDDGSSSRSRHRLVCLATLATNHHLASRGPPVAWIAVSQQVIEEAARRRTFAIISHPDAGKTTLTEKFLLYAGAIQSGGAVKAREDRRSATSDWMDMEQKRGISISSTALNFPYRNQELNLLDTPGHRDFSEDTYRVLSAVDAVVMVLDAAKGIEPQTLKLFEVCRSRELPVITFLNKLDRPGLEPLELLDQIEEQIGLRPTPATWPVGSYGDLRGVLDRRTNVFTRFTRTARGSKIAPEEDMSAEQAAAEEGDAWLKCAEESELLEAMGADVDMESFLAGQSTPVFAGSALTNFGVRYLLDAIVDLAPPPLPRDDIDGVPRPLESPVSAFVFKVQANMDRNHRDRIAFARICSGKFDRGMVMTCERTGKPFATKYASTVFGAERTTIDEAFPGDVVGLVNATGLNIGDTLFDETGPPVEYPKLPQFAPEVFASARPQDSGKVKQFRKGLDQLGEEGVVQVLRDPEWGEASPVLAAVGQLQFDVFANRLDVEFMRRSNSSVPHIKPFVSPTTSQLRPCERSKAFGSCNEPTAHSSRSSRTSTRCNASSRTNPSSRSIPSSPADMSVVG